MATLFGGLALPFILLLYLYLAALALLLASGVWVDQRRRMGGEPPAVGEGAEAS